VRLTTVVTGTLTPRAGEFNFAYAAHPRMFVWRERETRFLELGEGLEGLPLGYITGEVYNQQSVRLNHGDMILAFSDGATEVRSRERNSNLPPRDSWNWPRTRLGDCLNRWCSRIFPGALLEGVHLYRGPESELEDDITLLNLRRVA